MPDWEALFGDLTLAQALLWVVAVSALILLVVKGWPVLKALVVLVDTLSTLADDLAEIKTSLTEVRHEVLPNQGGSLRDVADRTAERLDTVDLRVQKAEARLENDHSRIAELTQAIAQKNEGEPS